MEHHHHGPPHEFDDKSKGFLFYFIKYSAFFYMILCVTVLKPHRLYKKFLIKFLSLTFKFHDTLWEVYHLLILGVIFYGALFSFLAFDLSTIHPKRAKTMEEKLLLLDKKWIKETMIWLVFIILVCILTIYRNALLFTKEAKLNEELEQTKKQVDEAKKEKKI